MQKWREDCDWTARSRSAACWTCVPSKARPLLSCSKAVLLGPPLTHFFYEPQLKLWTRYESMLVSLRQELKVKPKLKVD